MSREDKDAARLPSARRVSALQTWIEYAGTWVLLKTMQLLPVDAASGFGGWLGRQIGPRFSRHRRMLANLDLVFPHKSPTEKKAIARAVWDNAGRVVAEFAHLKQIIEEEGRIEVTGLEDLRSHVAENKGGFLLTAHYGNWEVTTLAGLRLGVAQHNLYRPARNPYVDRLLTGIRAKVVAGGMLPKGEGNLRDILRLLHQNRYIGMAVDQREERGLSLTFLGQDAATVHTPALLARRTGSPIFLGRAVRTRKAHFRLDCLFVPVDVTDDWESDVRTTTQRINDIISRWILESPDQWLWFHQRWTR
jgi:KDO2-lipid IV(A) lauroyltransferase